MKNLGAGTSGSSEQSPLSFSPDVIKRYLNSFYPDVKFQDGKDNSYNAIAFSDQIIFKHLQVGSEQQLIKSIQNDIKKLNKKSSPYKSLIYISDDIAFQDLAYKKNFLSKLNSDVVENIIPYSLLKSSQSIIDSSGSVDQELIDKHTSIANRYKTITPIVTKIFDYVSSLPPLQYPAVPVEHQLLRLEAKIKVNFWSTLRKDVHDDILNFWQTKMIIESFIKKSYNQYLPQFNALKSRVVNSYLSNDIQKSDDEVNNILIFKSIAESILPLDLKDNPDAFDTAKALVYYFFEYCLFGSKTEYDDLQFKFPGTE